MVRRLSLVFFLGGPACTVAHKCIVNPVFDQMEYSEKAIALSKCGITMPNDIGVGLSDLSKGCAALDAVPEGTKCVANKANPIKHIEEKKFTRLQKLPFANSHVA